MASQNEIVVGSKDFVVRIGGQDVRVAIEQKKRKASGRGYEFVVRRVDARGNPHGRRLTRGSGSLRKPGTPVKAFGGKAPPKPPRRKASKKRAVAKNPPAPAPSLLPAPPKRRASPKRAEQAKPAPFPSYTPPSLPSLRGRRSSTRAAVAKPKDREITVRPKSDKIKKVIRALEKLPEVADDYMIRGTVAGVLAQQNVAAWR